MNGISSNVNKTINEKYTQRVLTQEATNIFSAQDRVLARFNPKSIHSIQAKRSFVVSGTTLTITHSKQQRFIDMKNIRGLKRKPIPNHNVVIYGHFNNIINQLAFGLTDDVRALIAQDIKLEL